MEQPDPVTGSHAVTTPDGHEVVLDWALLTDTGLRRENNQDSVMGVFPLFVVADGMGGYAAGEIASGAVIARLTALAESGTPVTRAGIEDALRGAVVDFGGSDEVDEGTGTTVTGIAYVDEGGTASWRVFNIGDSRVYRLSGDRLDQITTDHSVVQELLSIGAISPAQAETHPHGNVITRAVGFTEDPVPDYLTVPVETGTRWVVCSDGLTKELTDYGIRHFLTTGATPSEAVSLLVDAALENGGRDNVSVLVLDVRAAEPAAG